MNSSTNRPNLQTLINEADKLAESQPSTPNQIDLIIFRLKDRRHYFHQNDLEDYQYNTGYRDGLTEAINHLTELSNVNNNKL